MAESCKKAMDIMKEYKDITETNKYNLIFFAYQQENLRKTEILKVLLNNLKQPRVQSYLKWILSN